MRVVRLIFSAAAITQAFITKDITLGILGLVVGSMSYFNIGCCGTSACNTNYNKGNINKKNEIQDVEFEEVVIK